jgi:hypothetical protein
MNGAQIGMWRLDDGRLLILVDKVFRREAVALAKERKMDLCANDLLWELISHEVMYVEGLGEAEWADDMIPLFSGNTIGFFGPDRYMTEFEKAYAAKNGSPFWLRNVASCGEGSVVNDLVLAWGWDDCTTSIIETLVERGRCIMQLASDVVHDWTYDPAFSTDGQLCLFSASELPPRLELIEADWETFHGHVPVELVTESA